MRRPLLLLALLAVTPWAWADVPARVYPSIDQTGPSREQPQALSHWQKMADDMAAQAAPRLRDRGVAVSANAFGPTSAFDLAFHDFLLTGLHQRGVAVTRNGNGARLEIDTFPLRFHGDRRTAHVHDEICRDHGAHTRCRTSHARYHRATRDELAVNLRVFDAGDLVFSGSTTYYLPSEDLGKYRAWLEPRDPAGSRNVYRTLSGDYGTGSWGR